MNELQQKLYDGIDLSQQETQQVFEELLKGQIDDIDIVSLLVSLKMKGEQPAEIAGAAAALKSQCRAFDIPDYLTADSCGTGGSGQNTVNVSTMTALLLAEMGLPMVKHGNRSISSKCGSADVLESVGVKIDMDAKTARRCLDQTNFCFFFAPYYHPGVKHVMPIRNQLKTRTIFNGLGPLVNPASPQIQLMGVYQEDLCQVSAKTLQLSGCKAAMIVHSNGYDEITLHSPTHVAELINGEISEYQLTHRDFGLPACEEQAIKGDTPERNAAILLDIIKGNSSQQKLQAITNTVAANAAALLKLSGKADSLEQGAQLALSTLRSGKVYQRLEIIRDFCRQNQPQVESELSNVL
jgi:anthranilate phosphoribosyltransferase